MAKLRVDDPPSRFRTASVEYDGQAPKARLSIFEDTTHEILSKNNSPDISFRYSVNPYRGCFHGCAYCYARPSHEYLGFGSGSDFERKIVIKRDAPALLEAAFHKRSWRGEVIVFSGNTDCYQPVEADYGLTRACLEVCARFRNPVSIITKATLIERDIDVLQQLHADSQLTVSMSIPFSDDAMARAIEPAVPSPTRRFETLRRLADAGLPVNVMVAPIMPGLNDDQIATVLKRARAAGARYAGMTVVRLPGPLAGIFESRLRAALPDRADRVMNRIREVRGGDVNDSRFGKRMRGEGPYAESIHVLFRTTKRRLGYVDIPEPSAPSPFRVPPAPGDQLSMW